MSSLVGRRVLITGSSRGIGAATAQTVVERGGSVILHGRRESDYLRYLAKQLDMPFIACDVADRAAAHEAVGQAITKLGAVDALVNCAGQVKPKPFLETQPEDWEEELRVNVMGTVWFCQAVIPSMVERGYGRIVNVASIRGIPQLASARGSHYSASKAAIVNLTASLAKEFGPEINVNCVAPGFIETDMSQTWTPALWEVAKTALTGRVAQPREPANVIAFLASEDASFVTGQTIIVDGGYGIAGK